MTYFKNVNTLETLRRQYKELLKIHHPDNGGNLEDMQNINAEYDRLFKVLKNMHESKQTSSHSKADYNNMKYDFAKDEMLREMLQKVIHFKDITIEVVENWLWLSGNTYPYRNELKELGFKFGGQKKMWYWHSETFRKRSRKTLSMDDIRNYYGSMEVQTEERKQLKQA